MEDGNHSSGSYDSYTSNSSDDDSFARRSVRRRYDEPSPVEDRISDLPDLILIQILSLLPFIAAIATARLSKRWRFLWKVIPNLTFSHFDGYSTESLWGLVSCIDKALLLHERSPIDKFSVEFEYSAEFRSTVDVWLHVLIGKNVEEINLNLIPERSDRYTVPKNFFTNSSLVKLTLSNCNVKPNAVVSWPSLKTLSISYDDELNDNSIESILSGSPVLESLELRKCRGVRRLNTTSASLKKLVINFCDMIQFSAPKVDSLSISGFTNWNASISLNLPSILDATLNFEIVSEKKGSKASYKLSGSLMTHLLHSLNSVEQLTIGTWCIQVLSVFGLQNLTCPTFTCKRLILDTSFTRWNLPGIANLLCNSVSLETLVIIMNRQPSYRGIVLGGEVGDKKIYQLCEKLDDKYWNSEEGALVNSLQGIKNVKIIDNVLYNCKYRRHNDRLLGLLQVILKNARMLEKVVICTNKKAKYGSLNSMEVTQRLLSFPKASSNAVILYCES